MLLSAKERWQRLTGLMRVTAILNKRTKAVTGYIVTEYASREDKNLGKPSFFLFMMHDKYGDIDEAVEVVRNTVEVARNTYMNTCVAVAELINRIYPLLLQRGICLSPFGDLPSISDIEESFINSRNYMITPVIM